MKKGGALIWIVVGIPIIALMFAALSVPVWKQNRYTDLVRVQLELKKEFSEQRQSLHELRLKLNDLSSRKSVGAFAEEVLAMEIQEVPFSAEVSQ